MAAGDRRWPGRKPGRCRPRELSRRHVMIMISPSFLAPDLVTAAMHGRLPSGIGVTRSIEAQIASSGSGTCWGSDSSLAESELYLPLNLLPQPSAGSELIR